MVAVGLVGVVVGVVLSNNGDSNDVSTSQIASIQQACENWVVTSPTGVAADCAAMAGWMVGRMGANGMTPMMMWGDPDRMRATCQKWMSNNSPTAVTDPAAWCDDMVSWMTDHMTDWSGRDQWGGWMDNGPMMGR